MKYGNMTLGRVEALINIIGGEQVVESLLNGTSKITIEVVRRLTTLTSHDVAGGKHNLRDFFKTRKGLWTSDNFDEFILAAVAKKTVQTADTIVGYANLEQPASDAENSAELPDGHIFEDVNNFLNYLATLIQVQWGGKKGVLLNNGYANIFYVKGVSGEVFAVHVSWRADLSEWLVFSVPARALQWHAGDRVFSATAAVA
jgi:hypothetical protein